jgi:S-adenosylmethionine uptake transporter
MPVRRDPFHHPFAPFLAVIVAIGLFATMDALMKRAAITTGVYSALTARGMLAAAVLWPVWRWRQGGRGWPAAEVLRLHALRGAVVAGMAASYFWGLVRTPLAEAIALSFIAPLIALFLAALFLGERLRRDAVAGSLVALAGVAVIASARISATSSTPAAGPGIAAILVSAVLYAWNLVLQRRQAQLAEPLEVALFQNLFVTLALIAAVPVALLAGGSLPGLLVPARAALPDIAWAALLASASVMLLAWAYARAEAQALVPLEYTAFPWAALTGWLWFGEAVTMPTLAGLGLILLGVGIGARGAPQGQLPPA